MTLRSLIMAVGIVAVLWDAPCSPAQQATERYIPVGKSPGLSGTVTVIGKIEKVDARARTITIIGSTKSWTVKITDRTKIWLDRSKLRQTCMKGTFGDFKIGLLVEIKYQGKERKSMEPAQWIKCDISKKG